MRNLGTLVHDRSDVSPHQVAVRAHDGEGWQEYTWQQLARRIDHIAAGLLTCGADLEPGDSVGILAETSYDWIAFDFGALSSGALTVPIYASLLAPEVGYVHVDTSLKVILVEDADQLAKVRQIRAGFTFQGHTYPAADVRLRHVVVINPGALEPAPDWESLADLEERGARLFDGVQSELRSRRDGVDPDDVATFTYTSGTTGPPKAVRQTARNHLAIVDAAGEAGLLQRRMRPAGLFLFLPLAHSFGRLVQFAAPVHDLPLVLSSVPTLAADLRETRPGFLPAAPRVFEKMHTLVEQRIAEAPRSRRLSARWALAVGRRVAEHHQDGRRLPRRLTWQHGVADRLVLARVRAQLGLDRAVALLSGAAPLQSEVQWFFFSLGLELYEAYGLTETCPGLSSNRPGAVRIGTVGQALPGVELRIADDGEILARGPNITDGYHGRPDDTRAVLDDDGWFHSGDLGVLDADGFLTITGRKKELIKTSGGKYVTPAKIEGALKLSPLVQEAVVVGDGRPYCVALIALDPDVVAGWTSARGLPNHGDQPAVVAAVDAHLAEVNATLASFETIKSWSAIEPPTVESGLLTASLKVKRAQVEQRWLDRVDTMYGT